MVTKQVRMGHVLHEKRCGGRKEMNIVEGKLLAQGLKFGIVVARFNEFITSKLFPVQKIPLSVMGPVRKISRLLGARCF